MSSNTSIDQPIRTALDGTTWRVVLNRPDCGNLVTSAMVELLHAAVTSIPREAKLLVLCGAGTDFCKGRDYAHAPEQGRDGRAPSAVAIRANMTAPITALYGAIHRVPVPTLALVQGVAQGFGTALAGSCDITVASEEATFRLPEMGGGLPPTLAMTALWPRAIAALPWLVYTGGTMSAPRAREAGLVDETVAAGQLEARGAEIANTIGSQPPEAVAAVKEYLLAAREAGPDARAALGASLFAGVLSSR
ncbi:MAG: enoyl-CoA hydratase/isomerase family protein [bacterium]|jgi:enoyl-CoA hydratase/carnithine racemase|nr:enoyl-CoA hydratase/isomerase family protein [Betaproteobacteria bacterium]